MKWICALALAPALLAQDPSPDRIRSAAARAPLIEALTHSHDLSAIDRVIRPA